MNLKYMYLFTFEPRNESNEWWVKQSVGIFVFFLSQTSALYHAISKMISEHITYYYQHIIFIEKCGKRPNNSS